MSKLLDKKPALLLVDIQKAFLDKDYPGNKRNNLDAELICGKILKKWRCEEFHENGGFEAQGGGASTGERR